MHRTFCVCLCEMGQQKGTVPADEHECATNVLKVCVSGRNQLWVRHTRSLNQPYRKHNIAQHTVNQRHANITSKSQTKLQCGQIYSPEYSNITLRPKT